MLTDDERRELLAIRDILKSRIAALIEIYGTACHEECAKTIRGLEKHLDEVSERLREDTVRRAFDSARGS